MGEQQQERSQESLRHEYSEVVQNVRHYGNLRFAILSIFFAVMAGVGFVAFGEGQFDAHAAKTARIAGFFVAGVFWLWEERVSMFYAHYTKVAVDLERHLGYTQYTTRPPPPRYLLEGNIAIPRLFFLVLMLFWVYAVFAVPLDR
jgi:hypothetical protein